MWAKRVSCAIAVVSLYVAISITAHAKNNTEKEIEDRIVTVNGYRQDEVEEKLARFVRLVYTPKSKEDKQKAIDEMRDISSTLAINNLRENIAEYSKTTNEVIQEMNVYYVSKENSRDGLAREYVDLKVGNDEVNRMYLIEMVISDDVIHKITPWRY